ncbi:MAG: rhamnulokinase [Clostridiales bacterium]|jgi:rhamnulokinase|nr:rhamnulokinase [Clostridiales bacterium]
MSAHLAIDIGASSGRHLLGWLQEDKIKTKEVHRFKNQAIRKNGSLVWDHEALLKEVEAGIAKCDPKPSSIGIDTWGVDFALLDKDDNLLGDTVAYRDDRTIGIDLDTFKTVSEEELFAATGIASLQFNTVFQLMAIKKQNPEILDKARTLLFIPDYLHWRLAGVKANEYSIASTSGLLNAFTRDWDYSIIKKLGLPEEIFQKIAMPGTNLGQFSESAKSRLGYGSSVVLPATHDTGSAFAAVPDVTADSAYISSGTWSLMGATLDIPNTSTAARLAGFTNEGGYGGQIRFLKNIMGLWMIQEVHRELGGKHSFAELCNLAETESIPSIVDCNDNRFLAPKSMSEELGKACRETGQKIPETPAELAAVIYNSLAVCYGKSIKELEELSGRKFEKLRVVGGGANADYLNKISAKATGLEVAAGPVEATAIGNMAIQMISCKELESLAQAREVIGRSFDVKTFKP